MSSPNSRLYIIDNSQYEATQTFLARYLPYSTSILTWFTRTLASQIAGLDDFSIYSSHPQLSSGSYNEPVTIIVKQVDRLRVFVSTEAQLNEEDPVWVGEDDIGLEKGDFHFGDKAAQDLYETSKKGLEIAIRYGNWNMDDIFFHGLSVLWCPLMYQMFTVPYNGPCERYICPAGQYLNNNVLNTIQANGEELNIETANERDFDQIKNLNKIPYQSAYVTECCKISTVLRKSDGDMVAWAFTHSDGAIGALHVLPEWRRLGLAQVVVDNLCVKQAQAFVNLPIKHQIYLQAIAENFNTASKNMFKKLGWTKSDIGVTWIRCQAKNLATNNSYQFEPDTPIIIGRGEKFGIQDRTVSRKQVQLEALPDGRCFVERLSENPSLLGTKLLPLKNKVEVKHHDIISLLPGKLPFQLNLPHQLPEEKADEETQPFTHTDIRAFSESPTSHYDAESRSSDQEQEIEYTIEPGHGDALSFSEESSYLGEENEDNVG